jgi:hypothetical protein
MALFAGLFSAAVYFVAHWGMKQFTSNRWVVFLIAGLITAVVGNSIIIPLSVYLAMTSLNCAGPACWIP